jgi:DNA-binding NarL/FixJ family response regulator
MRSRSWAPAATHAPRWTFSALRASGEQQLYALTPMQADIAAALFAGFTVEQLTQRLRISQNTVRTHLKGVFKKCAVRSQAQLMRLLALGPR